MKYDDASWHFGGDYPEDLPEKNAYTHIGMFLGWALINDLAGELHREEWPEEIEAVKKKELSGAEFLIRNCDGKFTDEDLNETGNDFATEFYENEYFDKYLEVADPEDKYETIYHIPDSPEIFDKVTAMISTAFKLWSEKNI